MILTTATAFTILTFLASSVSAAPVTDGAIKIPLSKKVVNKNASGGKADLSWVQASTNNLADKYHATLLAYEKNTGSPLPGTSTSSQRRAMKAKRQNEGLTDEQSGSFWEGQISIGTPAQNFNM